MSGAPLSERPIPASLFGAGNPYRRVHALRRRRLGGGWATLLPVLVALAATPFTSGPVWRLLVDIGGLQGVEALTLRAALLAVAAVAFHSYADLVRGPDRVVADAHPVRAGDMVRAIGLHTLRERAYLPLVAATLLSPIIQVEGTGVWLASAAVVAASMVGAVGVGLAVHISAVGFALSPRAGWVLELLRGSTPRMHAALIYSPGVALVVAGSFAALSVEGTVAALQGWAPGWCLAPLPLLAGALGIGFAARLGERWLVRTTAVLTEIEGSYAGLEQGEDGRSVYLEGLGRGRPELTRALRHGWRRHRAFAIGPWIAGALGVVGGWSAEGGALGRGLALISGAALLCGLLPARLAAGDPPWLDRALGLSAARVGAARVGVSWLYAQGALLPGLLLLGYHHGGRAALALLGLEGLSLGVAGVSAVLGQRWPGRGVWYAGPLVLLTWLIFVSEVL